MLKLTFANHYETLRDELLSAVASGPASPFAAEQIIIPSAALRRDLTLSMATRQGVCANVEFAYLAHGSGARSARWCPASTPNHPLRHRY